MVRLELSASWLRLLLPFLSKGPEGIKLAQQIRSKLCTLGSDDQTVSIDIESKEALEVLLTAIREGQKAFQSMESLVREASLRLSL